MNKGIWDIEGLFAACLTMFDQEGEIDEEATRAHISFSSIAASKG